MNTKVLGARHKGKSLDSSGEEIMEADARLASLSSKHAELEQAIEDENHRPLPDNLLITQLKRRKLRIKDEIARLQHA